MLVKHDSEMPVAMHRHDDARLIVFLEGDVQEADIFGRRTYKPGDVLFRPAYCLHANPANECGATYQRLAISANTVCEIVRRQGWRPLLNSFDLECRADRSFLTRVDMQELVSRLISGNGRVDDSFARMHSAEIRNSERMTVPKPYQKTRDFKRRFGILPTQFRKERRVSQALAELATSRASLAEIAVDCGYADQAHFSREIKGVTGKSPKAVRAAFAK